MRFGRYLRCEKGATVVEYVVIAAGIALGIMLAVFIFGGDLSALYDNLTDATNN